MNGSTNGSAGTTILTTVKWDIDNDLYLSDFVRRHPLPHIALVTKGRYEHIGAPSVHCPHLKPYVYLHSKRTVKKLAGQILKSSKDGKSLQLVSNQLISISELFRGYFEILSEDGKPVTPKLIESVLELNNKFPELILLRQQCKCYLADLDGELRTLDKTRFLRVGEILTLVGRFHLKKTTFLRCFDESGSSIFLKMSQKIKCSPVAQGNEMVGVHTAQSLMNKRLPLTIKLVQGPTTSDLSAYCASTQNGNGTNLIVRLRKIYREHVLFAYSIQKPYGQFLTIPLNVDLKFAPACNQPQVTCHPEFNELCRLCDQSIGSFKDKISLVYNYEVLYDKCKHEKHENHKNLGTSNSKKSSRNKENLEKSEVSPVIPAENVNKRSNLAIICDEEIDQLYDFIRGMVPQNPKLKPSESRLPMTPPPPPPISTIPGRLRSGSPRNGQSPLPPVIEIRHTPTNSNRLSVSLSPDHVTYNGNGSTHMNPHYHHRNGHQNYVIGSNGEMGVAKMVKTANDVRNHADCFVMYQNDDHVTNSYLSPQHHVYYKNGDYPNYRRPSADPNLRSHTMFNMTSAQPVSPLHFNSQGHYYRKPAPAQNNPGYRNNRRRPLSVAIPDRVHLHPSQFAHLAEYDQNYHPNHHFSPNPHTAPNFYPLGPISPRPAPPTLLLPHGDPNNLECIRRSFINLVNLNDGHYDNCTGSFHNLNTHADYGYSQRHHNHHHQAPTYSPLFGYSNGEIVYNRYVCNNAAPTFT